MSGTCRVLTSQTKLRRCEFFAAKEACFVFLLLLEDIEGTDGEKS